MPDDLDQVLSQSWSLLREGVANRRHGFHFATVATVSPDNRARARTVILRHVDETGRTLRFHTDLRSQKCADITANPHVAVVFYDEDCRTQLRIEGRAVLHTDDTIADAAWRASQPMSRLTYGTLPAPGGAMPASDAFTIPPPQSDVEWARPNFAAVVVHMETLQWLYLKEGGQRCANFDFVAATRQWTVPS